MVVNDGQPTLAQVLEWFKKQHSDEGSDSAVAQLIHRLGVSSAPVWLKVADELTQDNFLPEAAAVLASASSRYPKDAQLRFRYGAALWQAGDILQAEAVLRAALASYPNQPDVAFALAENLRQVGRLSAATEIVETLARTVMGNADLSLRCAQFAKQCQRYQCAARIVQAALKVHPKDGRFYAVAGEMSLTLGQFDEARKHYLLALESGLNPNDWFLLQALADSQRYSDPAHADFARFERHSLQPGLSPRARASILFAWGKACDDVADYEAAVKHWRQANAIENLQRAWSHQAWGQLVASQLQSMPRTGLPVIDDFVPIFVVGMPRSGTTILTEWLARHPAVKARGELNWLGYISERLTATGTLNEASVLHEAARLYFAQIRQDDAPARWYVDKNPLNFRYLSLIGTLFPNAKIIHCRRDLRDTAISLWAHSFASADNGFAYDLNNIATVGEGCQQLVEHGRRTLRQGILEVEYETLVQNPAATLNQLAAAIGLPDYDWENSKNVPGGAIATASLWQARQPIYDSSIGRWKRYSPFLPELIEIFPLVEQATAP